MLAEQPRCPDPETEQLHRASTKCQRVPSEGTQGTPDTAPNACGGGDQHAGQRCPSVDALDRPEQRQSVSRATSPTPVATGDLRDTVRRPPGRRLCRDCDSGLFAGCCHRRLGHQSSRATPACLPTQGGRLRLRCPSSRRSGPVRTCSAHPGLPEPLLALPSADPPGLGKGFRSSGRVSPGRGPGRHHRPPSKHQAPPSLLWPPAGRGTTAPTATALLLRGAPPATPAPSLRPPE
ncbi:uncharacterized protein LOC123805078 isoform X1 [Phyllostomus hastatus]|uniref:uncharacterized protein LOC123805078 isoform X1 n=1 Tax=Phyllostomus hastatus TaxID=9423 RepID=UPI001E67E20E|nr:uncharacterized protein LOC123805078 isoform X1 [Phyllostomus hastatus]